VGALLLWLGKHAGSAVPEAQWLLAMARMAHRGPHGVQTLAWPGIRIACFQSGTPSERVAGPLPLQREHAVWLLDGWLIDGPDQDACLHIAERFERRGVTGLCEVRGHYSTLMLDRVRRECLIARDPGGARHLYYRRSDEGLWLSSDLNGLLSQEPNPVDSDLLGYHLLARAPEPPRSFFADIALVPAGQVLRLGIDDCTLVGQLEVPVAAAPASDSAAIAQFNRLLDQAVQRSLIGAREPGLTASGGMDSGAIAGSAARQGRHLPVHSWSLTGFPASDEAQAIVDLCRALDFPLHLFRGNEYTPLGGKPRPHWPGSLRMNPYRELKHALYLEAVRHGRDLLLNGDGGDQLYGDPVQHLDQQWRSGSWRELGKELLDRQRRLGWRGLWRDPAFRRLMRTLSGTRAKAGLPDGRWTASGQQRVRVIAAAAPAPWMQREELRAGIADEHAWADSLGLEVRSPLRDPDLMAFMHALPAHLRRRRGLSKWIARRALADALPRAHVARGKQGNLTPFLLHGLRQSPLLAELLSQIPASVADWLTLPELPQLLDSGSNEQELLRFWQALSLVLRLHNAPEIPYAAHHDFLGTPP